MDINVFTVQMRAEFLQAYQELDPTKPAPWEKYTTVIPSTARTENYAWMSPTPGVQPYVGHRRFGHIDAIRYTVNNLEFDMAFEVLNRDIKDDVVGGYKLKAQDLGRRASLYPGRLVLKTLAAGTTTPCFDGSNFVATTHTLGTYGTGGNLLSFNPASNDAVAHNIYMLIHDGPIKPLVYQNRMVPDIETDAGTPQSKLAKKSRYWMDMEGAGAYGWWWDVIKTEISDTPTITEMQTIIMNMVNQARSFRLPKAFASDDNEVPHEQIVFSKANTTFACSTGLGELLRQVIDSPTIVNSGAAVTNIYYGIGDYVVSAFLN